MTDFLEILKYTLPALIVFATAYFILHGFLENDERKRKLELQKQNQKYVLPIRLQAYERLVLFLERISPDSILLRVNQQNLNCAQLQQQLLIAIRTEFEHNLTQQIYVSSRSWNAVKTVKDNFVKLINTAKEGSKPDAPAIELSTVIVKLYMSIESPPIQTAIDLLKSEMSKEI